MKLWNYKSNDLPKNGSPTRAWRRQTSHQLDKRQGVRGPKGRAFIASTQGLNSTYNYVSQYIWGYFPEMCNKSHWILQRIYRLTVCDRRAFALSRRCRVSRSRPRVFHETIMSYHCDITITVLVTMESPEPEQWFVLPYKKEFRASGYRIKKTRDYGYHIRKTKWYGYADQVGCIRVNFGQSTG